MVEITGAEVAIGAWVRWAGIVLGFDERERHTARIAFRAIYYESDRQTQDEAYRQLQAFGMLSGAQVQELRTALRNGGRPGFMAALRGIMGRFRPMEDS